MIYRVKYCGTDFDLLGPGHKYLGIARIVIGIMDYYAPITTTPQLLLNLDLLFYS